MELEALCKHIVFGIKGNPTLQQSYLPNSVNRRGASRLRRHATNYKNSSNAAYQFGSSTPGCSRDLFGKHTTTEGAVVQPSSVILTLLPIQFMPKIEPA